MAEEIRSDIEKIERALNIRVEDVEIELAFNAAIPQSIVQDCSSEFEGEHSFAMRVNLCAQRNLFQLYKHCQTINPSQSNQRLTNEILPIQIFESYTQTITDHLPVRNEGIQYLRRMMQREEKARLTSKEIIEKLIESIAKNLREILEHRKTRDLLKISDRDLIKSEYSTNPIDWTHLSEISMNNQYTEKSCRLAWEQVCLPIIHRQNEHWSKEEDRLLENLVQIHGAYADQWANIAANFAHRSPFMCANRYMILENTRLDKMKFSSDQIAKLKEMIRDARHGNYIPLNKVAYEFGCSLSTIRREWRNIDPDVRRGQWQVDEDERLLQTVAKQSNRKTINWNLVASEILGRSLTKCYHRYIHLTQQQNKADFQPDEDQLLIEQHQSQNARWSQIQLAFPGRSCYTLQNRYRKLIQYRQINELFNSQSENVRLFLLRQFPSKSSVKSPLTNLYHSPSIQLNYEQLQCLTSSDLFGQFCDQVDMNVQGNQIGLRQFLKHFSQCEQIDEIKQIFYSTKSTRRR